jgi:hypothetical protein
MSRGKSRRPTPGGSISSHVVHASTMRARVKTARQISRQSLALASRARAAGLTELSRLLETVAMHAASTTPADDAESRFGSD